MTLAEKIRNLVIGAGISAVLLSTPSPAKSDDRRLEKYFLSSQGDFSHVIQYSSSFFHLKEISLDGEYIEVKINFGRHVVPACVSVDSYLKMTTLADIDGDDKLDYEKELYFIAGRPPVTRTILRKDLHYPHEFLDSIDSKMKFSKYLLRREFKDFF